MLIRYVNKKLSEDSLTLIRQANAIIESYEAKGYSLTLRQLYYQFVARGLMPNSDKNYNRLGEVISNGRLAGLISWMAIEDRTRNLQGKTYYRSPADVIAAARASYRLDKWAQQPCRPEVWVEKEALVGVIAGICSTLDVDFFACRGYNSQSEAWGAGQRFTRYLRKGQRPIILHLGDHDPSGIDMTRDNRERTEMFVGQPIQVIRLALNIDQVEKFKPPPNPAKLTDSRATDYVAKFGYESWELDALAPDVISELIRTAVMAFRDETLWSTSLAEEASDRDALDVLIENMGGPISDEDE